MEMLQCEKCGGYLITIDLSTNKRSCSKCKSDKIKLIDSEEVNKKFKRFQNKLDILGRLFPIDEEND